MNPVNVDEFSQTNNYDVWTGTMPGGIAVPGAEHCGGWESESPFTYGHVGSSAHTDLGWLFWPNDDVNPVGCIDMLSLYCVEQP
jgi:hypothetical protein